MKPTSILIMLMSMAVIITVFMGFGADVNRINADAPKNNLTYFTSFTGVNRINTTISTIQTDLSKVGDTENGWMKFLAGLYAVPKVVIVFVTASLAVILDSMGLVTDIGNLYGLGIVITLIGGMLMIYILGRFISFFQRSPA